MIWYDTIYLFMTCQIWKQNKSSLEIILERTIPQQRPQIQVRRLNPQPQVSVLSTFVLLTTGFKVARHTNVMYKLFIRVETFNA